MSRFRPINRDTDFLLPPSVQGRLPRGHLARYIVEAAEGLDLGGHAVRKFGGGVRKLDLRQLHEPGAVAGIQGVIGCEGRVGADPAEGAVKGLIQSIGVHLERIAFIDLDPIGLGYINRGIGCLADTGGEKLNMASPRRCVDVDGGCRNFRMIRTKAKRAPRAPVQCILLDPTSDTT
jgi:hypothetical protein